MAPDETAAGGDPACWLHLVCDGCGAVADGEQPHDCTAAPTAGGGDRQPDATPSGSSASVAGGGQGDQPEGDRSAT